MLSKQQKRLRRENYNGSICIPFSEKTCDNKKTKLEYYGTIQDLYDQEYQIDKNERED